MHRLYARKSDAAGGFGGAGELGGREITDFLYMRAFTLIARWSDVGSYPCG